MRGSGSGRSRRPRRPVPPVGGSLTSLIVVDVAPGSPSVGQPFASGLVVVAGLAALARRRAAPAGLSQCARRHTGNPR